MTGERHDCDGWCGERARRDDALSGCSIQSGQQCFVRGKVFRSVFKALKPGGVICTQGECLFTES